MLVFIDEDIHGLSFGLALYRSKVRTRHRVFPLEGLRFNSMVQKRLFDVAKEIAVKRSQNEAVFVDIPLEKETLNALRERLSKAKNLRITFIDHHYDREVETIYKLLKNTELKNLDYRVGTPMDMAIWFFEAIKAIQEYEIAKSRDPMKWLAYHPTAWTIVGALGDNDFLTAEWIQNRLGWEMFWILTWSARYIELDSYRITNPMQFIEYAAEEYDPTIRAFRAPRLSNISLLVKGAELYERRESHSWWIGAERLLELIEINGEITEVGGERVAMLPEPINFFAKDLGRTRGKGAINKYVTVLNELPESNRIQYFVTWSAGYSPLDDEFLITVRAWGPEWFLPNKMRERPVRKLVFDVLEKLSVKAYGHYGVIGGIVVKVPASEYDWDFEWFLSENRDKADYAVQEVYYTLIERLEKLAVKQNVNA